MKNVLKKSILGIPVGLIASTLLVTSAAAAWILNQYINVSVSTANVGPIEFSSNENQTIRLEADLPPEGLTCSGQVLKGVLFRANMSIASPGDVCYFGLKVDNFGSVPVYIAPLVHSLGAEFEITELSCGNLIPAYSTDQTLEFMIRLTDQANPNTVYDDLTIEPNYDINMPVCPY